MLTNKKIPTFYSATDERIDKIETERLIQNMFSKLWWKIPNGMVHDTQILSSNKIQM